jgi:hypothetical protein
VRHIPDGVLRRLDDEPLAVPDKVDTHLAGCARCGARREQIADDAERAAMLFAGPQLVPDLDTEWARLQHELQGGSGQTGGRRRTPISIDHGRARSGRVSLRAGLAIGAIGIAVAGTAAAASLTTIFAPTQVAPVSLSRGDVRAIAALMGLGESHMLGGFPTPTGSTTARFGRITWSSSPAHVASTLAQASAAAGFAVSLPTDLPAGVGAVQQFVVQPRVHVTVAFNGAAGKLAGSSATLDAGPAVLAGYGSSGGPGVPTLAVVTMPRPTALSTGASTSQIEAFLLRQPGIPPQLSEEIRLLGDLRTTLPVPVPAGASVRTVRIAGRPGVLLADSSNAAAGVVWEDGRGMLHLVAGVLDSQDVLNVAKQLG